MTRLLTEEEIERQLADLPDWRRDPNASDTIRATFTAPDFPAGIRLVSGVADAAEQMQHHPDIDIRWTAVSFALSTHSEGGLTQKDIELAHQISQEARRLRAEPGPASGG
ncbi:4a-hydroxytetrahydrobiopterin dehydratase [Humibacillus sp. DSM 29435]|uniref:4a-hydroxytetrahydrobiopterin dehydratase n=1 Tax=Humibacillus sp. DSM 29435 TaxID=1869167 RepID=UPI00087241DD|nr:4a-hydroxytetrahydrobiopterin dehydratase [Humibacillus sp. DSM 29435]OFE16798.1 4a-hydroxytetrahydrobiopterin dehydratase [Humibacillus sp. DSM 29435]